MVHKSKRKGNNFENKVYKEMRKILPDIKLTIGSGNSEGDADLISDHFIFELKRYKRISETQYKQFWKKLTDEAEQHDKQPVLIFKEDYRNARVMINMHLGTCTVPAVIEYITFKDILRMGFYEEDTSYY